MAEKDNEAIENLESDKQQLLASMDDANQLRARLKDLAEEVVAHEEDFSGMIGYNPILLNTEEARNYGLYMKKAQAFNKKAEGILSVIDQLDTKLREQINTSSSGNDVSEDDMRERSHQTDRLIKAYSNSYKYWQMAQEEYLKLLEMDNNRLAAEAESLRKELRTLQNMN